LILQLPQFLDKFLSQLVGQPFGVEAQSLGEGCSSH
jgi:hypothetical protein